MARTLVFVAIVACVGCGSTTTTTAPHAADEPREEARPTPVAAHAGHVYDGEQLILELSDVPGALLSTALPPPGVAPPTHPFLSGSPRSAAHEGQLRTLLDAATDLPSFLQALRGAGFRVEP